MMVSMQVYPSNTLNTLYAAVDFDLAVYIINHTSYVEMIFPYLQYFSITLRVTYAKLYYD
jgi:hypothetical protein